MNYETTRMPRTISWSQTFNAPMQSREAVIEQIRAECPYPEVAGALVEICGRGYAITAAGPGATGRFVIVGEKEVADASIAA